LRPKRPTGREVFAPHAAGSFELLTIDDEDDGRDAADDRDGD
jgi:hypothetical protein